MMGQKSRLGRNAAGRPPPPPPSPPPSPDSNRKVLVPTGEDALRRGPDAVSIHVNLGAEDEARMLRDFGTVSTDCQRWGIPLLAMIYTRGPKIRNEYDARYVRPAARG